VAHAPLVAALVRPATRQPCHRPPQRGLAVVLSWPRRCRTCRRSKPKPKRAASHAAASDAATGHAAASPATGHAAASPAAEVLRAVKAATTTVAPRNLRFCYPAIRPAGRVLARRPTLTRSHGRHERMISSPSNIMSGASPVYMPLPLSSGPLPGHLRNPLISASVSGSDAVASPIRLIAANGTEYYDSSKLTANLTGGPVNNSYAPSYISETLLSG
jgi:hypothetical protein